VGPSALLCYAALGRKNGVSSSVYLQAKKRDTCAIARVEGFQEKKKSSFSQVTPAYTIRRRLTVVVTFTDSSISPLERIIFADENMALTFSLSLFQVRPPLCGMRG